MRPSILVHVFLLSVVSSAFGLGVGDPAPPLQVETMVKGEKVDLSKGLHVVEFWATWCGPCKASIPHLTELAKTYQGRADFTGVDVWEHGDDQLGLVKKFVDAMGEKMGYNVAFDGGAAVMTKSFMEAARQSGIPTAFLVKDGVIHWIGHPMAGLDTVMDQVLAGKFDMAAAKAEAAQKAALEAVTQPIEDAMSAGKYAEALAAIDKAQAAHPELTESLVGVRFQTLVMTGSPEVKATAQTLMDGEYGKDANALNGFAWSIIDPAAKIPNPDYQTALQLAERAAQVSGMKDSAVLDTYALALFKTGDKKKALEVQTQAVELAKAEPGRGAEGMKEMEARLAEYQRANG